MIATENKYQVWPFAKVKDGYSIPDNILIGVWNQLLIDGTEKDVFYSGEVKTATEWVNYIKEPTNYPVFVVDTETKKICFVAWLNSLSDHTAFCHFFSLGKGTYRPEMAQTVLDYWKSMGMFMVLLGLTPANNPKAVKAVTNLGYTVVGEIPYMCYMAEENKMIGGIVSYYILEGEKQYG